MDDLLKYFEHNSWNKIHDDGYCKSLKNGGYIKITVDLQNLLVKKEISQKNGIWVDESTDWLEPYIILKSLIELNEFI